MTTSTIGTIGGHDNLVFALTAREDPIVFAAEEESGRSPKPLELPPLKWSAPIARLAADHGKAWQAWSIATDKLIDALMEYETAKETDAAALKRAAREGDTKHPGTPATEKARPTLELAIATTAARRNDCDTLNNGTIESQIRAEIQTYTKQVREQADAAHSQMVAAIETCRAIYGQARSNANHVAYLLHYLAPYIDGITYDGGAQSGVPELRLPTGHEISMSWINGVLDRIELVQGN